ncbi:MAG: [protein-PII] uridylyltransferase [Planctomycetota bacterium]|nr:[protein-PII] uridylyltransferase [Planctomycetota bacterium]
MTSLSFRPSVLRAKQRLAEGREQLMLQHQSGSPGIQVCACLTDLLDAVVLDIYNSALDDLAPAADNPLRTDVTLVAHGGYGRRDVAPFSDVDLMILYNRRSSRAVTELARRMMHDLYDVGLALGQSVRSIDEACKLALKDATIYTSLVESRCLAGSDELFNKFTRKFLRQSKRYWRSIVGAIQRARQKERTEFGETVYLLEPNVKRTRGGLRDIQLLRWVGMARYGQADPEALRLMGVLPKEDQMSLRHALEFILRVRNELHFHYGKSHDVLDRAEQVRLAATFGYQGTESLLPVEQFMREYFRHTSHVRQITARFLEDARPWSRLNEFLAPLFSHRIEDDFRVGPHRIAATRTGLAKIRGDLAQILRLADLSNIYDKRIAPSTWKAVYEAAPRLPNEVSAEAAERFLSLLSQRLVLGELLHNLHELGVLEKILPDFAHARCLLQFNEYHKYTVDEHCIRAVECTTEFANHSGHLGAVYRNIKQKRTLHLALLIHDLGKGYVEDHSEVGARIAIETGYRLRLPDREIETLRFLVHKHLVMSHLAFRRDTSDDQVILRFAVEVGSPDVLSMLFVLTCADLAAVGPGVLNDWKVEVLTDLYQRTMQHLTGDSPTSATERRRSEVRQLAATGGSSADWLNRMIDALPSSYLHSAASERIADDLRKLVDLKAGEIRTWCSYLPETQTVEYTVATYEGIAPGVFHKLTGGLSSQGLQILSADINTLHEGLILDRFVVLDPDYAGEPPPDRLEDVCESLRRALTDNQPPAFRRIWGKTVLTDQPAIPRLPTRVRIDNHTSDQYTILDIFAADQMGLLYLITKTLFELGLSVSLAKIGTYLDQIVDVFYVTDRNGGKIKDEAQLHQICQTLLDQIENHQVSNVEVG